jgi:hypothetical protein
VSSVWTTWPARTRSAVSRASGRSIAAAAAIHPHMVDQATTAPCPGQGRLQPVQRQVVGVLARGHVGDGPGAGQALLDRLGGPLGRHQVPLAPAAGEHRPHVLQDEQAGRGVLQLLADGLGDPLAVPPAARARDVGRVDRVLDPVPGQVGRQRPAAVPATAGGGGGTLRGHFGGVGQCRLDPACEQEQLGRVEPLGARAVEPADRGGQPALQGRDPPLLVGDDPPEQRRVVGERRRRCRFGHGREHTGPAAGAQARGGLTASAVRTAWPVGRSAG